MLHPYDIMKNQARDDLAQLVKAAKAQPTTRKILPNGRVKGSDFQPLFTRP